jgi:hypothetical protein
MDRDLQSALTGLILLFVIIGGTLILPSPPTSGQSGATPASAMGATTPGVLPVPTTLLPSVSPAPAVTTAPESVQARIDAVDASQLALGRISYAYVTLTNTGTAPITRTRIEVTAGRDFGFPLGYQSRFMIHELYDRIEPGENRTLADQFDLPLYEGIIPLEGSYEVTVKVFVNDFSYAGEWQGEVYLRG